MQFSTKKPNRRINVKKKLKDNTKRQETDIKKRLPFISERQPYSLNVLIYSLRNSFRTSFLQIFRFGLYHSVVLLKSRKYLEANR